jgi:hypothetical protein
MLKASIVRFVMALLLTAGSVLAQSTLGTILGTVRDSSGAVIPNASVKVTNTDEGASQQATTDSNGNYLVLNQKPAHYSVEVTQSGFQTKTTTDLRLIARQELRVDVTLEVGQTTEAVTVQGTAGVITTDTQAISSSYDSLKLLNLPANTRANGSTSPYTMISALPGLQADNNNAFSIQGGLPSQSEASVDGISTTDVTGNSPLKEAFPSIESIAELRVDGVGNAAEYGQPGEITTISKSGTNQLHGDFFWYQQNRAFDATAYGTLVKPQKVGNDYGVSAGGPVVIPHLYNGRNKSFFYGTFEGFQFPRGKTIQNSVPTDAMRTGDFSKEGYIVHDPAGNPYPGNKIPSSQINPIAASFLKLYPSPNAGDSTVQHTANYVTNQSNNYTSNQFDVRGDQYFGGKQSVFGRFTWKNIDQDSPTQLLLPASTNYERVRMLVVSHNYSFTPSVVNEFRFGLTFDDTGTSNPFDGPGFTKALALQGIGPNFPFNGVPELDFSGNTTSLNVDRLGSTTTSKTYQINNNLSWTKGRHTMKFGFDIRHIRAITPLGFIGANNYGNFSFDASFTGSDFADFLLGLPADTSYAIVQSDNNGATWHYNFFAQDSFKVSPKLTLEYGVRYEYHPSYQDASGNIGNFDPTVARSGRVIYPTGKESLLAPGFLADFNACPGPTINGAPCTPVVSASQAGLPESLRVVPKDRIMPRFGFAWRPFGGDKTVVRGGFGIYNITVLGSVFYSLTGTLQSDVREFQNGTGSTPSFAWPQIASGGSGLGQPTFGTAYFGTANAIHFKDPYSMQWNFSVDRNLGWNTGLRLSYIGMKTNDLVWAPNLNQMYYSTQYARSRPLSDRPFPNWGTVYTRTPGAIANYHSGQVEVTHRFSSGLTFNSAYTFAKNLADNGGPNPSNFSGETGGGRAADLYDRHAEYGNVSGTRRHRWTTSAVYDLPFGRGRHFGSSANRFVDAFFGGWQMNSIFLWQGGPWLTPYFNGGGDPAGTGSGNIFGQTQVPDRTGSGVPANQNRDQWVDAASFVCPGQPISAVHPTCSIGNRPGLDAPPLGRYGNSGVGIVEGPGTVNLSAGLAKYFNITEHVRFRVEGSFTNVLNHVNLADPNLNIANRNFGQITSARISDFGGNRVGQIGARIDF